MTRYELGGSSMSFRQAIVFTIGGAFTAGAQGFGPVAEPYTPAADAKDLKAVLFKWMWGMGMLKGHDERDMVASLEYQGKGTIQVDGQPCTLTKYRASTNYQTFSQRIQYTCTRPNGQTYSNIEVVSGLYAWNEDTPGAEIGPNEREDHADAGEPWRSGSSDFGQVPRARPRPRWQGRRRHSGWGPTQALFSRTVSRRWAKRPCRGRTVSRS